MKIPAGFMREWTCYDIKRDETFTRYDVLYGSTQIGLCYDHEPSPALRVKARRRLQKSLSIRVNRWGLPKAEFVKLKMSKFGCAAV